MSNHYGDSNGHGGGDRRYSHRSRVKKQHHQYLTFLRKWKSYVHNQQYQPCQQLCLEHIERINKTLEFNRQQNTSSEELYRDLRSYRSKVRNLYAVLLHDHLKQHDTALDQYEQCIQDDPSNASAHYNWAILYKNYYQDYETAATHYKQAILLKPDHAAYHNNYGLLLEQQLKRYDEAKEEFAHALKLDPTNGRAHTNMANLLKKQYKNYKEAAKHYQQAIHLDHKNPTRHFNYALFLKHNLKDYTGAAEEYEKALDLDPNYQQAHKEYLTFLLTESPLHRKKNKNRHKHGGKQKWLDPNSQTQNYEPTPDELHEHAERCVRYAIKLMWKSKFAEAKDILNMALRCDMNHRVARLLSIHNDPRARENDPYYLHQDLGRQVDVTNEKIEQLKHGQEKLNSFHLKLTTLTSQMANSGGEASWVLKELDTIGALMKQEVTRLEEAHYIYDNGSNEEALKYANGSVRRSQSSKVIKQDNANAPLGRTNLGGSARRSNVGGKRSSVVSISSVNTDYDKDYKMYELQRNVLANAILQLENIAKDSRDTDLRIQLHEVKGKVESTLSSLMQTEPKLTARYLGLENTFGGGGSIAGSVYRDGNDAQTLGAMSMVSTTSSAAMEQRKNFLKEAYNNPDVPMADRAVAKWLTHEYLQPKRAPQSMLSSGHLPSFQEEDNSDNDESDEDDTVSIKEAKRKRRKERKAAVRESRVITRVESLRTSNKISKILEKRNDWDFDVFGFVEHSSKMHCIAVLMCTLCEERQLSDELEINLTNLCNFCMDISQGYLDNPYHNRIHGCDVLMNAHYYMQAKIFRKLDALAQFSCLLAAACHDVGHPGTNNDFQVHTESEFAVTYNDEGVLENFHVAKSWRVLQKQECNFMEGWNKKDRRAFRRNFISGILGTDMGKHKAQQGTLTDLIDHLTNNGVDLTQLEEDEDDVTAAGQDNPDSHQLAQQRGKMSRSASVASIPATSVYADTSKLADVALPLIVHTADLTNPAKPFDLFNEWATRIVTEFFAQGDMERKLNIPVSNVCDRHKTDKPTVQTGFINFIIKPWFTFWARLLTDRDQGPLFMENIDTNFKKMNEELQRKRERDAQDAQQENSSNAGAANGADAKKEDKSANGAKAGQDDDVPDDVSIHTDEGMNDVKIDNDRLDESKIENAQNGDSKSMRSVSFGPHDTNGANNHVRVASSQVDKYSNRKANKLKYKRAASERHLEVGQDDNDNGSIGGQKKGSGSRSPSFYNNIIAQNARTEKAVSIVAIPFEHIARVQHQQFAATLQSQGNNVVHGDYSAHSGADDVNDVASTHSQDNLLEDYGSGPDDNFEQDQNGDAQNGNRGKRSSYQGKSLQKIPEEANANNIV